MLTKENIKGKMKSSFKSFLLLLLLLIKFDTGFGDSETKNNVTVPPTLCKFIYVTNHCFICNWLIKYKILE